jgi:hypothetical protein
MIEYCKAYIPSGMCRSVEWNTPLRVLHPVKDASPTASSLLCDTLWLSV